MSKLLEEVRAELAQAVGKFFTGTATGGSTTTIVDTNGLKMFSEADALNGALAYIRSDTGAVAPQGQSKWITDYVASTYTITLESALTAAVAAGDVYEVYLARLTIAQWVQAINEAIDAAWPEIYLPTVLETTMASATHTLDLTSPNADFWDATDVWVKVAAISSKWHHLPRQAWSVDPTTQIIYFTATLANATPVRVRCKDRYPTIVGGQSTFLNYDYLMAQARANVYGMLAESGPDESHYVALMDYWTKEANRIKAGVARELAGMPLGVSK